MARSVRIPDLLTTANLVCGAASVLLTSQGQLTIACWLLFLAAVFDVLDGLAARALGGGTALGAQLDSLADMVSFGLAPGFALWSVAMAGGPEGLFWWAGAALCICIASAWRLAKFNVDDRQHSGFLGLPTPANGLFWASMVLIAEGRGFPSTAMAQAMGSWLGGALLTPVAVFGAALLLGLLMLSELPLPSLKFKHGGWKGNEVIFLLLLGGTASALLFGLLAVPLLLILYVLSPLWGRIFQTTP
ncbi:MAG: CDP-alcohol phosphatidyltransferase family protein [Flavobacteriales bacterium]|nr:CDP-alcohol phosphatidyltransferase family protein [Flavobacteriales bacterium]